MSEKKIFVYKLLLSLNISDFSLFFIFYVKTTTSPLGKSRPLFLSNPHLKIWLEVQPPVAENGLHTMTK